MKNFLLTTLASLAILNPVTTSAAPVLGFSVSNTPYGTFGCRMRAENKLFSMGATNVVKTNNPSVVWGVHGVFSVGVWCRGSEAIIMVAGDGDTTEIRNELQLAF